MINKWNEKHPEETRIHRRRHLLKRDHNMTLDEYDTIFISQCGQCSICKTTKPGSNFSTLVVDHSHTTGKRRGLLCSGCNTGLGMFGDDSLRLRLAADYLEKYNGSRD